MRYDSRRETLNLATNMICFMHNTICIHIIQLSDSDSDSDSIIQLFTATIICGRGRYHTYIDSKTLNLVLRLAYIGA